MSTDAAECCQEETAKFRMPGRIESISKSAVIAEALRKYSGRAFVVWSKMSEACLPDSLAREVFKTSIAKPSGLNIPVDDVDDESTMVCVELQSKLVDGRSAARHLPRGGRDA